MTETPSQLIERMRGLVKRMAPSAVYVEELAEGTLDLCLALERAVGLLSCEPLQKMLGMIEDSGDAAMWEQARWFMERRDQFLRQGASDDRT